MKENFQKKEITSELGDILWGISLLIKAYEINPEKIEKKIEAKTSVVPMYPYKQIKQEILKMRMLELQIKVQKLSIPVEKNLVREKKKQTIKGYCKDKKIFHQTANKIEEKRMQGKIVNAINAICKLGGELGITLEDIMQSNLAKLNKRYDAKGNRRENEEREIS